MNTQLIKRVLFTIASLASVGASADGEIRWRMMEDLPSEQRTIVYEHVLNFLEQNPEWAAETKAIAVDQKGTVYVLDEKMVPLRSAGQPSCITGI